MGVFPKRWLGKFRTIMVDPPWPIKTTTKVRARVGTGHIYPSSSLPTYPVMSFDEIGKLPIESIAAENSHLWLWTLVSARVTRIAYELCETWGFTPKTEVVWVKIGKSGKLQFTLSATIHTCHERCIFATRGKVNVGGRVRSVIITPRRKHSQKPEEIFQCAERLSHPPRIELFAREKRTGWSSWGNEV